VCVRRLYWFGAVKYNIGGLDFSANDVEHGVLRANAASPTSVGSLLGRPDWAGRQFKAGDPRLPLVRRDGEDRLALTEDEDEGWLSPVFAAGPVFDGPAVLQSPVTCC